jgi:murein DD-endopeptidase MepM/ murein hydrolase activator NlpD
LANGHAISGAFVADSHAHAMKVPPAIIRFGLLLALLPTAASCSQLPPVAGEPVTPAQVDSDLDAEPVAPQADEADQEQASVLPTPIPLTFPEVTVERISDWRPPPYPVPLALRAEDHFYFLRPIPSGSVNWPHPSYRYGGTFYGEQSIHTGVDLGAARGTDVLASAAGEVVWAGYGLYRGEYDPTDPYGLAIAIRHDFGYQGEELYTVYGHLSRVDVWQGQRVSSGEVIGAVGNTGHASGDHLHFEVRLARNRYFETRNPELWMVPPEGWGVLAGRVLDSWGRPLPEVEIQIESLESGLIREVFTYAKETVHPDEVYKENFVISDLPSGPYEVRFDYLGKRHAMQIFIDPGLTSLITFRGRNGFQGEVNPSVPSFDLSALLP